MWAVSIACVAAVIVENAGRDDTVENLARKKSIGNAAVKAPDVTILPVAPNSMNGALPWPPRSGGSHGWPRRPTQGLGRSEPGLMLSRVNSSQIASVSKGWPWLLTSQMPFTEVSRCPHGRWWHPHCTISWGRTHSNGVRNPRATDLAANGRRGVGYPHRSSGCIPN